MTRVILNTLAPLCLLTVIGGSGVSYPLVLSTCVGSLSPMMSQNISILQNGIYPSLKSKRLDSTRRNCLQKKFLALLREIQ
jgi:hypothetical protein